MQNQKLLIRPREAREMLGCCNERLYDWLNSGQLKSFKDGRARRISVASVHALIERLLSDAGCAERKRRRGRPRKNSVLGSGHKALAHDGK